MNDTLNVTKVSVSVDVVAGDGVAVSYTTKVLDELESDTTAWEMWWSICIGY